MDIDYIFPWVNPNDESWRLLFYKYRRPDDVRDCRFRDFGLLKYVFRGIAKNMPWIHKVHLILAQDTQLPSWINTDMVNIVYHKDYIPKEFLPTFNSHTIESYLGNIKGLSEHLIYGNDDVYPLGPSSPDDWFTPDGKPKIRFTNTSVANSSFKEFCKRNFTELVRAMKTDYHEGEYIRPCHYSTPLTLTAIKETSNILKNSIKEGTTRLRNFYTNFNYYIFAEYSILKNQNEEVDDRDSFGKYLVLLSDEKIDDVTNLIKTDDVKVLCINDTEKTNVSNLQLIAEAFQERFPEKCKYEK